MKVIDADRYRSIDGHRSMHLETHRGAINIASKRPGCDARVTEKAIHDASIGMAVMDWIDDDATDRGVRRRTRARACVHRPTRDRPIDRSRPSSRLHPPFASSRPRIHSFDRAIDRSVGRSMDGMDGMDGHHIHPSTYTYRQTDDTYIHDNRPIIIYYIERERPTDPRAPPPPTPPRARSTSHDDDDDDDDFFRRSSVVDATTDSRDDRGTNERAPRVSVGDDDDEGRRRRR